MAVASVKQKSYAARQDSVQSGFGTEAVPGSGNQGSTKPLLKQKQRLSGTENQPAMVKDAWTGWDDHLITKKLESTHCTHIAIVVAREPSVVVLNSIVEAQSPSEISKVLRRRPVVVVDK